MNKLFLFITAVLFCVIAEGQERHNSYAKLLSDSFIEETNGFIDKVVNEKDRTIFYIGLPSFYNFDLVRIDTRKIVNEYSDITVEIPWGRRELGFSTVLELPDDYVTVLFYMSKENILVLSVSKLNL